MGARSTHAVDVERMLRECVPGGHVADPQQITDAIRAWFSAEAQRAASVLDSSAQPAAPHSTLPDALARIVEARLPWAEAELPPVQLPVTELQVAGAPAALCYWPPTSAQLAAVNAGAQVSLLVKSRAILPVTIIIERQRRGAGLTA